MSFLKTLDPIFKSSTIKPSFKLVHVILSLYLFAENPEGIGRYRLENELNIGSGSARSLVKSLREKIEFISLSTEHNGKSKSIAKRRGHILTKKGNEFLEKIKTIIPIIKQADINLLKDILIDVNNIFPFFCLVKQKGQEIDNGIKQRDAAIMISGVGATCLLYDGKRFKFPDETQSTDNTIHFQVERKIETYFEKLIKLENQELEKNDVVIIGLGKNIQIARLSALNAALTLI